MHPRHAFPAATVVGMVAEDMSPDEILRAYPDLVLEDIREAMLRIESGAPDSQVVRRRGTGQKLYRKCSSITLAPLPPPPVSTSVIRPN